MQYVDDLLLYSLFANCLKYYFEQFARTGEPEVPSLKNLGLLQYERTTLPGFFALNVRRAEAAKVYLRLFLDNDIDAIMMPPAPHTAVPLDTWSTASYTGLWNYLDYPAIVIPVDTVRDCDVADDVSNAKFGPEDAKLYSLCKFLRNTSFRSNSLDSQLLVSRHGS
jgi:amidase